MKTALKDHLIEAGLTENEAKLYELMVEKGQVRADKALLRETGIKRGNAFYHLYNLVKKGLVEEFEKNRKKYFRITSPDNLIAYFETQEARHQEIKKSLENLLPSLKSKYFLHIKKPNIRFYEGREGLKKIYDDILIEGKDFLLIRSIYEKILFPKVIENFIKKRLEKGIKVEAITPLHPQANRDPEVDKRLLFARHWVSESLYDSAVEIDIYGNKVAFLSMQEELIGVIIESKQIANSMRKIFHLAKTGALELSKEDLKKEKIL